MSKLTLDEAIKHCLEVAEENDLAAETYEILAENNHNAYEKLTAETNSSRCAECATDHRQLAEWLADYKELGSKHWDECRQIAHYDDEIKRLEAADVQPVKRGRWENEYLEDDIWWAECSNCKQETHSRYGRPSTYRYCPNCGARMDGEQND